MQKVDALRKELRRAAAERNDVSNVQENERDFGARQVSREEICLLDTVRKYVVRLEGQGGGVLRKAAAELRGMVGPADPLLAQRQRLLSRCGDKPAGCGDKPGC